MKRQAPHITFTILTVIFWLVAPVVFVAIQYSSVPTTTETARFKVGITGIVLIIVAILLAKKLLLGKYIKKLSAKIVNFETQIATETDLEKAEAIEKALRRAKTIESLLSFIAPFAFIASAAYIFYSLEQDIVKLSGVMQFIVLFYALGEVCQIAAINTIKSKYSGGGSEKL